MSDLWWSGVRGFGFSLVLTPILRDIFRSYKVVDQPDHKRKVHVYPIPRVGGIAIMASYFLALYIWPSQEPGVARQISSIAHILPAALLVFFTGLVDDFFGLKPVQKLAGQVVAAGLAWWLGVRVTGVGGQPLPEIWTLPLTVGWLLLCTNAFNLVDGLDGLAAGAGLFATLTIFVAALIRNDQSLMYPTLPLAGCLIAFLCFNFNPATVFLGDCGSLLIGFLLGCFGVMWTAKSLTLVGLTAPLIALSIPLLDVLLCIVRRWLRHQPIFSADRGHIHHRLLDRGLSPRQAVLFLYGLCGLAATCSLLQSVLRNVWTAAFVVAVFAAIAWMGVHYLQYAEFMLAGQILRSGEFQRTVNAHLNLSGFEKAIADARTTDECWETVLQHYQGFGLAAVRLNIDGILYEHPTAPMSGSQYWTMHIALSERGDYIEFARELASPVLPMAVMPLIDLVASALTKKLQIEHTQAAMAVAQDSTILNSGG